MDNKRSFLIFQILLLMVTTISAIGFNQLYILLIGLVPTVYILKIRHHWFTYLIIIGLLTVVVVGMLYIPDKWKLVSLAIYVNNSINNNLRQVSLDYLQNNYNEQSFTFIKMLLFNEKIYTQNTYSIFRNLGILHLFVVSGLHVSIISSLFNKIFRKWHTLAKVMNFIICGFLWYFSNFSLPILRILLINVLSFFKYMKKFTGFTKNCMVAIFICISFVRDAGGYSFILTFLCTLTICYMCEQIASPIIRFVSINLIIFVITLPIVITFNKSFNAIAFINNFGFSWLIIFIYITELMFVWITPLSTMNEHIISYIINYFESILALQPMVNVQLHQYIIIFLYGGLFSIFNWKWNKEISIKNIPINYNTLYVKK